MEKSSGTFSDGRVAAVADRLVGFCRAMGYHPVEVYLAMGLVSAWLQKDCQIEVFRDDGGPELQDRLSDN